MSHDDPMSETNGNRPPIDPELISAFFDGETTPEERTAVEESMGDGGATLQTLDEYDQLSQSLKQLHRAAGSPDLRASVMTQLRPPARVAAPAMSRPRRRLLSVVAGLTGMAAAVTLLMWPRYDAPRENMLAVNDTEYEYTATEAAAAAASASRSRAPAPYAGAPGAPAVGGAPAAEAARMAASADAPPSAPAMAEMESGVASRASSLAEMTSQRPLPEVGDVIGYLDENADELTWVAVTVVDVQTAANQVQLLLAKHGVESPDGTAEAAESAPDPDNQMTFVVEADWDQMEAVIVDLTDSKFVNSLVVDAPADEGVPKELQGYRIERSEDPTDDAPGDNQLLKVLRMRVENRQKTAPPASADALVAGGERQEAVQLQLLVPDAHLKRIAARRGADPSLAADPADQPAEADADDSAAPSAGEARARQIGRPLATRRPNAVIVIQQQAP